MQREFAAVRGEMREGFASLRGEIHRSAAATMRRMLAFFIPLRAGRARWWPSSSRVSFSACCA